MDAEQIDRQVLKFRLDNAKEQQKAQETFIQTNYPEKYDSFKQLTDLHKEEEFPTPNSYDYIDRILADITEKLLQAPKTLEGSELANFMSSIQCYDKN
jgi:hypothetical protein